MIVEIISKGEHLTLEGLQKIVSIKSSLYIGLSEDLKKAFSKVVSVLRPLVEYPKNFDNNWLSGFIEGSFHVLMAKSKSTKTGLAVQLQFRF